MSKEPRMSVRTAAAVRPARPGDHAAVRERLAATGRYGC